MSDFIKNFQIQLKNLKILNGISLPMLNNKFLMRDFITEKRYLNTR